MNSLNSKNTLIALKLGAILHRSVFGFYIINTTSTEFYRLRGFDTRNVNHNSAKSLARKKYIRRKRKPISGDIAEEWELDPNLAKYLDSITSNPATDSRPGKGYNIGTLASFHLRDLPSIDSLYSEPDNAGKSGNDGESSAHPDESSGSATASKESSSKDSYQTDEQP
jgi:hypothetical protein